MNSWKLVVGWLVALIVTTGLTWQIVSLADNQVGARPAAVGPSTSGTVDDVASSTSTSSTSTTITTSSTPTTTIPGQTEGTSSSSSSSSSTSSTTSPSSSPTTTADSDTWSVRTVTSVGGTVVVRYRPNEVELQAATPAPGFELEIDDAGPPRVRVEFDAEATEVRIEVRWEDNGLDVEVTGDD